MEEIVTKNDFETVVGTGEKITSAENSPNTVCSI